MTTQEFVRELRERGVELRDDNGKLNLIAPRGVIDARMQAELRTRKQEILAALAADAAEADGARLPAGMHPLSDIQQSLWYLESEQPDLGVFNLYLAERIHGQLDVAVLESALQELLERHEMLRAVFTEHAGQPVQKIAPVQAVSLAAEAVSSESALMTRLQQELVHPFDKRNGALYRYRLFRLSAHEHVLLLVVDHAIADGVSIGIMRRELFELHAARCEKREPELPPLRRRYLDLVREERRWLNSSMARRQLDYWKRQLAGELPQLDLPTDHARPAMPSGRGDFLRLQLERETVDAITATARTVGASPFMFISAVVAIVLARLSGQDEVVIGAPYANRDRDGSENLVGLFINPVALRIPVDRRATFNELLQLVRERCVAAFENQSIPFDKVVEAIAPLRDSSRTPIFQALVTHLPDADHSIRSAGIDSGPVAIRRGTAQTDVAFWCRDNDAGIAIDLEYSTDLFTVQTARQMLRRLEMVTGFLARTPAARISDIPMLSEDERVLLTREWGAGPVRDWPRATIDALLRQQCEQRGTEIASSCGDTRLAYSAIGDHADHVARVLQLHGVGRGDVVGVLLERDARLPGTLLGILERGATYLPLDPEAPAERLKWMLEDANVRAVLCSGENPLPGAFSGAVINIDAVHDTSAVSTSAAEHRVEHAPEDTAYIIYTSGSTGRPKGVLVPHHAVVNFLRAMQETLEVTEHDRFLALTTLTFDIAALELLLPLYLGAHTEIVPREIARDGDALVKCIAAFRPTVMQATPATWQLLLSAGWQGSERLLALSGGEALPSPLADALLNRARAVVNLYGPTETTVWSTAHRVERGEDPVSIGRPIANTQVYVLDASGQLAAPGVSGELYIGGDGVTSGYLNRPELNAERFVPDTFGRRGNAKLYRTGDRVRFMDDGRLEYVGRVDFQIKLRGHRIEPGEIENALESHEAVKRAVVAVREIDGANSKDPRLVAYMTLADGARINIEALRQHLKARLPAYMLPQHYVDLETMPLTPSGKVDRKALPSPLAAPRGEQVPPATPTEQRIAGLWREIIGTEQVSANDNFFDLGGHSLSSMKVIARIDEALGVRLRPRLLVLNTLREIAAAVDEAGVRREERPSRQQHSQGKWKSVVNALLGRG